MKFKALSTGSTLRGKLWELNVVIVNSRHPPDRGSQVRHAWLLFPYPNEPDFLRGNCFAKGTAIVFQTSASVLQDSATGSKA